MFSSSSKFNRLTAAILLALASTTVGAPSPAATAAVGQSHVSSNSETFYSGQGTAIWANGTAVAVGIAPREQVQILEQRQSAFISCYGTGTQVDDVAANNILTGWCEQILNTQIPGGGTLFTRSNLGNGISLLLSITADPGCSFPVSPLDTCTFNFQQPLNDCNTATSQKQGGMYTTNCAQWRIDPGTFFENGSDF